MSSLVPAPVAVAADRALATVGVRTAILNRLQDQILGLLDTLGAADDLDSFACGLVPGHGDLAASGLADAVDLAAALPDDVAVGARVGEDEVPGRGVLQRLLDRGGELCSGLGEVVRRTAENPGDFSVEG